MASVTFTIGGVSFGALNVTSGRKAVNVAPESFVYDVKRFHVPGVTGNYIVRGGRTGGHINCSMRYIGDSLPILQTLVNTDQRAWENSAVTIAADGTSYYNCNLTAGGMKRTQHPRATSRSAGQCFIDVDATFTIDGTVS